MAKKKFTELPAATTPLAGTEIIAIVQDGVSKQVSVDDIPAGGGTPTLDQVMEQGSAALVDSAITMEFNNGASISSGLTLSSVEAAMSWGDGTDNASITLNSLGVHIGSTKGVAFDGSFGNAGQKLQSNGVNSPPSWVNDAGGDIEIGTTAVTGGTNSRVLYNNAGVAGEYPISGTGNVVMTSHISSFISQGVFASRPAASSSNIGYLYYSTDTSVLYRSNGTTWDVWAVSSAIVNVKDFGVVGDGVTNDGPALNTLIGTVAAGTTLFFPSGTYMINTNVAVNKELYFTGQFPNLTTTSNISIVTVTAAASKFSNLIFTGQGKSTPSRTAQFGLNINAVGRTQTINCTFIGFPGGGFFYTNTYISPGQLAGAITGCVFYNNAIGIASGARGEYFAITGCIFNSDNTGMSMAGGNNIISNCNFNYEGVGIEIISGTNNAHGIISNSNFNHCTTYGINAHDFTLGQTFSNIHMYQSPLRIADATGAKFMGGTLDCDTYTFSNATALIFENVSFGDGYTPSISLSGTNTIAYINSHHIDGRVAYDAATFGNTRMYNFVAGTVQTTNATTLNTTLAALTANTGAKWKLEVVAKNTANNDVKIWEQVAATNMTAAASGAIVGAVADVFTPISSAGMATATSSMDVSSDNLRANFTGIAATTIKWDYRLTPLVN